MDECPAPVDAAALIHGVAALGHPEGQLLDRLVRSATWLRVPAGRRLFSEGEPGDGMYVLFEGRVRLLLTRSPVVHTPWEVDPVAVFGEGALLTGGGRSRTAVVVRDALLARVPPDMFEALLHDAPDAAVAIARRVAQRTVFPDANEDRGRPNTCRLTLISTALPAERLQPLADAAATAMGADDSVTVLGREQQQLIASTVRHSDRVIIVVDAASFCDVSPICDAVGDDIDPLAAPTLELLLLQRATATHPSDTARWLRGRSFSHHLHLREGVAGDLARFARHVSGSSVGLVLGGGGARGFGHIGVIRAMHELSIPIDTLGGSSMGAIIAGQCAMGWTWEQMLDHNERLWSARRPHWEATVPTVSLFSGKRTWPPLRPDVRRARHRGFLAAVLRHQRRPQRVPPRGAPARFGRPMDPRFGHGCRVVATRHRCPGAPPHRRWTVEQRADRPDARPPRRPDHRCRCLRTTSGDDRRARQFPADRNPTLATPTVGAPLPGHHRHDQSLRTPRQLGPAGARPAVRRPLHHA